MSLPSWQFLAFGLIACLYMFTRSVVTADLQRCSPELWAQLGRPSGPREGSGAFVAFVLRGAFAKYGVPSSLVTYLHVMRILLFALLTLSTSLLYFSFV